MARLSVTPEETVHIGDSFHDDACGARRARIDAWHLTPTPVAGRHATVASLAACVNNSSTFP
jgi:FMN phosphatase YigB (HAD superfamily)